MTPPSWIFGPVWTVLYIMIACCVFLYFQAPVKKHATVTVIVLFIHIVSNAAWTFLFFRLQSPLLALIDIIVLLVTLSALVFLFWMTSVTAAALLVPYVLWSVFAAYLNAGFYVLNRT